jgi:murein DD-endopeptidase MepM/ murein hydrolase activator NlpD
VNPRHVSPSKRDLKRIQRESSEIGKLYRTLTFKKYWKGPFRLPIKSKMTSPYGTKRTFNGELKSFHQGLDLRAAVGDPIRAGASGRVVMAKSLFFTGRTVILDHGYGVYTIYAHMSAFKVRKGQMVRPSTVLGLAGMTGRASGPHLHWGAVIQRSKVNPAELLKVMR